MTSKTRFGRHRVRCSVQKCRARSLLKKHPDEYKRKPKCFVCGGRLISVEMERRRETQLQETCYCFPIPFPHRKGSLRFCDYHHAADIEPTEEELEKFKQMCETPRSG